MNNEQAAKGTENKDDRHDKAPVLWPVVQLHIVVELEEVKARIFIIEHFYDVQKIVLPRNVDRLFPFIIFHMPVCPFHQQSPHYPSIPVYCCHKDGSLALIISHVYLYVFVCEEISHDFLASVVGCPVKGSTVFLVTQIDINFIFEEDEGRNSIALSGHDQNIELCIICSMDISTKFDQIPQHVDIAVKASIQERCESLNIFLVHPFLDEIER
jgi:hypothetical protein